MTALMVFGIIAGIITLLLVFSVTLYVSITEDVRIKGGMFGLRFDLMSPEKDIRDAAKEKKEKKKKKKKPNKKSAKKRSKKKAVKKKPKNEFSETVHFILDMIKGVFSSVVFILRHVRLTGLSFRMSVGSEEPDKTAFVYSGINMAFYNVIALLKSRIIVKVKTVDIRPDFLSEKIKQDIYFKVKIRLGIIILGVLGILYNVIKGILHKGTAKEEQEVIKTKKTKIKEGV